MRVVRPALALLLAGVAIATAPAQARIVEEEMRVPVKVTTAWGREVEREIVVALFHDDALPRPRPVALLNHGRSFDAKVRAAVKTAQYAAAARWLTGFGFLVAVPIRIGYGATGGDDVEDSGPCNRKLYPAVYQAAAVQSLAVLEALRGRPDVLRDRAIAVGQSFGGTTAITLAARNPAGVRAAINFAGGGGGNPDARPRNPCGQPQLQRLFADYGKTARIPTLWIYSENDLYFGETLPRQWFEAFKAEGGMGELAMFPPFGSNGHLFFSRAPEMWQPRVRAFLEKHGYRWLRSGT